MGNQSVISIAAVIDYIENHLDGKLELETVAEAVHYSPLLHVWLKGQSYPLHSH